MTAHVRAVLDRGEVPMYLKRRATVFGNEVEFRWQKYHNTSTESVLMEFNVSEEDFRKSMELVILFFQRTGKASLLF